MGPAGKSVLPLWLSEMCNVRLGDVIVRAQGAQWQSDTVVHKVTCDMGENSFIEYALFVIFHCFIVALYQNI